MLRKKILLIFILVYFYIHGVWQGRKTGDDTKFVIYLSSARVFISSKLSHVYPRLYKNCIMFLLLHWCYKNKKDQQKENLPLHCLKTKYLNMSSNLKHATSFFSTLLLFYILLYCYISIKIMKRIVLDLYVNNATLKSNENQST